MEKILGRQAEIDLEEIFVYVAERRSVAIADHVIDSIVDTCKLLNDYPEMGRRRPEFDTLGFEIRSLAEGNYLILYTIRFRSALVVRVFHGGRDISRSDIFLLPDLN